MAENDTPDRDDEEEKKKPGLGRKLLGLFVESPAADDTLSIGDDEDDEVTAIGKVIVRPISMPSRPLVTPAAHPVAPAGPAAAVSESAAAPGRPPPPASYKTPDFNGIFKSIGMPDDERDRLTRAEEALKSLPVDLPAVVRKQTVEAILRAFNIPPEKIASAATRAIDALQTYAGIGEQDLKTRLEATEKRLKELRTEQERLTASIAERQAMQATLLWDVRARQGELKSIIEFFGALAAKQ